MRKKIWMILLLMGNLMNLSAQHHHEFIKQTPWELLKETDTARDSDYFSEDEKDMINEINRVRAYPSKYLEFVEAHIEKLTAKADELGNPNLFQQELEAATELWEDLYYMEPAPILHPHKDLYKSAKRFGKEQQRQNSLGHDSKKGEYPWERINREVPEMIFANENIIAGVSGVRDALLALLIDEGMPDRPHRRTLLEWDWHFVACANIGTVGNLPNTWIQTFGKAYETGLPVSMSETFAKIRIGMVEKAVEDQSAKTRGVNTRGLPDNSWTKPVFLTRKGDFVHQEKSQQAGAPKVLTNYYSAKDVDTVNYFSKNENPQVTNSKGEVIRDNEETFEEKATPAKAKTIVRDNEENFVFDEQPATAKSRGETTSQSEKMAKIKAMMAARSRSANETETPSSNEQETVDSKSASGPVYHKVEKGETLYAISRKYNVTVERIVKANGLEQNVILVGQQLFIPPKGWSGNSNNESQTAPKERTLGDSQASETEDRSTTKSLPSTSKIHVVEKGETLYSISRAYGVTTDEIAYLNQLNNNTIFRGQELKIIPNLAATTLDNETTGTTGTTVTQPENARNTTPSAANTQSETATFMSSAENDMLAEINLVRSNPKGYVQYIKEYIQSLNDPTSGVIFLGEMDEQVSAAEELIKELNSTPPLSVLKPHKGVYQAAEVHGKDIEKRGSGGHVGSDGSYPWDRILRYATDLNDGNENLVGGPESVREAIVMLLVDAGIDSRGHRNTLLNPEWSYGACYQVGTVGGIPNYWVQTFAK